jgi:peptidoglycan/xylan/chitin deacetylase (PgdA/CDA1 family)
VGATQRSSSAQGRGALWQRAASRVLRDLARGMAYRTGALSLYHRLHNQRTLTVVTFHRVLRRDDPCWETALTPWTVADDTLDQCLAFFKQHYTVVSLADIRVSIEAARPLPARSLHITFDDGFADNFDCALPLLRKHGLSATVFISSDVIGREERLWTEDLLWAFATGRLHPGKLACLHTILIGGRQPGDEALIWDIVRRGPALDEALVEAALLALQIKLPRVKSPPQMLNRAEIVELVRCGVSIGAHGKTHAALPFCRDAASELSQPREILGDIVTPHGQCAVDAMSFPHGAYTPELVDRALGTGYSLLFTCDAELAAVSNGWLANPVLGRIDVDERRIAPSGRFRPDVLAASLFTAPHHRKHSPRRDRWDRQDVRMPPRPLPQHAAVG